MILFEKVAYSYMPGTPVFETLDLEIGQGLTLVEGPNGSGKSTLLKLAAGVEKPDKGIVSIDGLDIWEKEVEARKRLAYVPEHPDLTPYATLHEILRLVCHLRRLPSASAPELLASVGLSGLENRSVRELSLGQRRRVVLAAAMAGEPDILILDEPLDGMDREMRGRIVEWAGARRAAGGAVLVATHEVEAFTAMTDSRIRLENGRLMEE